MIQNPIHLLTTNFRTSLLIVFLLIGCSKIEKHDNTCVKDEILADLFRQADQIFLGNITSSPEGYCIYDADDHCAVIYKAERSTIFKGNPEPVEKVVILLRTGQKVEFLNINNDTTYLFFVKKNEKSQNIDYQNLFLINARKYFNPGRHQNDAIKFLENCKG